MERNPYSPPDAAVADPNDTPPMERPKSVTYAIRLVWAAFVLGIPFGFISASSSGAGAGAVVVSIIVLAILYAVAFGVCFWLLNGVGRGKNWARVVLVVLFLLNVAGALATPALVKLAGQSMPEVTVTDILVNVVLYGLMIAAFVCMFSRSARPWFARRG